jgi:hypothetical protein
MKMFLALFLSTVFLLQCKPQTKEDIPIKPFCVDTLQNGKKDNNASYWLNTQFLNCLKDSNISDCRSQVDNFMVYSIDSIFELYGASYVNLISFTVLRSKKEQLFLIANNDTLELNYSQRKDTMFIGNESFITNTKWKKSNCYFKIYGQSFYEKYEDYISKYYSKDSIKIGYDHLLDIYLIRYGISIDDTDVLEFIGDSIYISDYLNVKEGRAMKKSFLELSLKVKFPK